MRCFRLRLSTVFWITTVVAVILGWMIDRQHLAARHARHEAALREELQTAAAMLDHDQQHRLAASRQSPSDDGQ
jgi:hypothetical protein